MFSIDSLRILAMYFWFVSIFVWGKCYESAAKYMFLIIRKYLPFLLAGKYELMLQTPKIWKQSAPKWNKTPCSKSVHILATDYGHVHPLWYNRGQPCRIVRVFVVRFFFVCLLVSLAPFLLLDCSRARRYMVVRSLARTRNAKSRTASMTVPGTPGEWACCVSGAFFATFHVIRAVSISE